MSKLKTLKIVIEETGDIRSNVYQPFIVYLEGDKERIGKTNADNLSAAEFWGMKLFEICGQCIKRAGVIDPNFKVDGKKSH